MHVPRTRRSTRCSIWILGLGLVLAAPPAARGDESTRIGVHVGGGFGKYTGGNLDHTDIGPMLQGGLRLGWTRNIDVLAGLRYGSFAGTGLPDSVQTHTDGSQTILPRTFHNRTTQFEGSALYSFHPEGRWSPLVFGGGGVSFWRVVDLTGKSTGMFANGDVPWGFKDDGASDLLSGSNWTMHFGVGAEFEFFRRAWVQVGGRLDWLIAQHTDNTGASAAFGSPAEVDANQFLSSLYVGVHYLFTERDSDQDGIANKSDACPEQAEDKDGFQDFDGCPEGDNDGDGIADASDKAIDQAEDKDGFQDEDGAPDPDNDGDGILDASDKAPDQAEDKDGFQDEDGVPDPDNDADGVLDTADRCASTPAGVPVDSLGCPTVAKIDKARVLAGIRFRTGTAELEGASFAALDSVLQSLRAYPELQLEVQGHTSDVGANDQNLQLSQKRAEAVASYLVSKGIEARRLTPIGYGEESPLVKNDSPENRARNERIMISPMETVPLEPVPAPEKRN